MKAIMLINIISIILGVAALSCKGITYPDRENIIDMGPIRVARETEKTFLLSSFLVGLAQGGRIMRALIGIRAKKSLC
jgi:hypothetical protein